MRLAYIVQGHKNPEQIARLVRRLQSEDSRVWWHVTAANKGLDRRVSALLEETPNVNQVPSQKMYWNSWSFMRAILSSLDRVLESGYPFDYVVLMTGQDYPLLSRRDTLAYFDRLGGKSMLEHFKLPASGWESENGGLDRFQNYHFVIPTPWPEFGELRFQVKPPFRRALPTGFELWGGSGYWALSRNHAEHLMRIVREDARLERLFRFVAVPDELFVHSILMSTRPGSEFVNQASSLVLWESTKTPHPLVLVTSDFDRIVSSGHPFARKFDATIDGEILDLLDQSTGEAEVGSFGAAGGAADTISPTRP